jgi:HSP20 family molecular chaperone IbpA
MTDETKSLDVQKEEIMAPEGTERTRERVAYIPRTDIYENDERIVIVADVPGADENSIDLTLEKNVLSIKAFVDPLEPEGFTLALWEYGIGDFERSFKLSDEVDRDSIEAAVKNGVLRVALSKAGPAKAKKIAIKSG